ncbi:hypothetical protein [Paraburkholderia caledonica]|uniref:hypothetical protein n=1 Tax=Paraburkholderia caledonica TaxID=134536 RepID=UPI0038BB67B4
MSLIYCTGCAKQIHVMATACPGCGAPNATAKQSEAVQAKPTKLIRWAYILGVVFPIGGIIAGIRLLMKKQTGHGIGAIALSAFMVYFWSGFWPAFEAAFNGSR